MLIKALLVNSGGKRLGITHVDPDEMIVHYGGGYFARTTEPALWWKAEPLHVFRQPNTIYCPRRLDAELPADADCSALKEG